MSWPGYLAIAATALFAGHALWVLLATRQLRGRSVEGLSGLFPELAGHRGKAALYCYSDHCGPCKRITPVIDALSAEHPLLFKLDIGKHPAEARGLGIQATPTILLIEDGQVLKALVGPQGLAALRVFLSAS